MEPEVRPRHAARRDHARANDAAESPVLERHHAFAGGDRLDASVRRLGTLMWRKILEFFQNIGGSGKPQVKITKRVSITTTDKTGERHHYGSLEELPPELREEIEKTTSE